MQPTNLRCEYFINPLGIDARQPRLSWQLQRGQQSAYQIVVDNLWDTGKIASPQSTQIPYAGPALESRQHCTWKVRTWNERDEASPWSDPATWEMGLLERADWTARWIASPIVGGPYSIPPVPILRKTFTLNKDITRARLYITALGLYELGVNNQSISNQLFAPGRTDYTKRVPYDVFDVQLLLRQGENDLQALLGDGWYCGHLHSDPRMTYGDRPRLLAQLELAFADGSTQTLITDETWQAGEGPIRAADMLMGIDYDARIAPRDFRPAIVCDAPNIELTARRCPPVRPIEERKPIGPPTVSKNKRRHIFDLGQNMVGHVRLRIPSSPPNKTIDLRFTEMLDHEGKPYTQALRTARATDHYTTRDNQEETFEPHFTFHGFRYVEVRDYPGGNPTVDDLTAVVIHSDCEPTGHFECSDPLVNQLQQNIVWSQKGNFIDIPTDCPQRDERAGWTGDAQVFIRTAAFNMNVANFFTKWLTDVADAQDDEGRIPSVVPHIKTFYHEGGPAWADAAVICPWTLYLCYADTRILEQCWPTMTKFMGFLQKHCKDHIRADEHWKWKGYGDWLSMNAETPPDFIGTAFYAHCAQLMSKMAKVLGKIDEFLHYTRLASKITLAFRKRFINIDDDELKIKTQTAYVLALHFNLLDEHQQWCALDRLITDIKQRDMHLSTGFVGTPYLNHVLTRFGRSDIAYALLMQKTYPSWLYPVTQGATTMWERWDAWTHDKGFSDTGMNSFNHYAFGAIGDWLYRCVAGIDTDESNPGYKKIIIRPQPGGGLTWARARLNSLHGEIESSWRIDSNRFKLDVRIPPNTTATIHLPDKTSREAEPGTHSFECTT